MTASTTSDRRRLRSIAMQVLFHCDVQGRDAEVDVDLFVESSALNAAEAEFVRHRVRRAVAHWPEIDDAIRAAASNWELGRICATDRAVLRLAVVEMLYIDDIPVKVAINEAIELARSYGTAESPQFVNGVLDAILKKHNNP